MERYSLRRLVNGGKVVLQGRPRCLALARSIVQNKMGLEIGGPSRIFRNWYNLPIYDSIASLDNCDFSQSTTWATHSETYHFSKRRAPGAVYFHEGSDLSTIPNRRYDFVLSSHNLEHFANPVKGLKEWQRVLVPGGHLVLVLPHGAKTVDQRRAVTPVRHMLDDYERQTDESDLTHLPEHIETLRADGGSESELEKLRMLLLNNRSHRMMHHHVFDEVNSRELLESLGMKVLAIETQLPFHLFIVAQTP